MNFRSKLVAFISKLATSKLSLLANRAIASIFFLVFSRSFKRCYLNAIFCSPRTKMGRLFLLKALYLAKTCEQCLDVAKLSSPQGRLCRKGLKKALSRARSSDQCFEIANFNCSCHKVRQEARERGFKIIDKKFTTNILH